MAYTPGRPCKRATAQPGGVARLRKARSIDGNREGHRAVNAGLHGRSSHRARPVGQDPMGGGGCAPQGWAPGAACPALPLPLLAAG